MTAPLSDERLIAYADLCIATEQYRVSIRHCLVRGCKRAGIAYSSYCREHRCVMDKRR